MSEYKLSREKTFKKIKSVLADFTAYKSENAIVCSGDSLNLLKEIPEKSISLILIDPPYHSTKKKNIHNDTAFSTDEDFIAWIEKLAIEWHRILKPNGCIYLYCSSRMSAQLEVKLSENFNILSHIVWTKPNEPGFDGWKGKMKKESLRQWYGHSERIIFAEPAVEGNLKRSYFANYLREKRLKAGLSGHKLTELTGAYGKVNHGGAVSNWETGRNVPSEEQFDKIKDALLGTGKIKKFPPYQDLIRPFEVNKSMQFTDVWNFYSVKQYKGKHPAEKPIEMLEHCITSSSYEGDIVLDCFSGSGSTAIASLLNNRKTIAIDLDEKWVWASVNRLKTFEDENFADRDKIDKQKIMKQTKTDLQAETQSTLFTPQ